MSYTTQMDAAIQGIVTDEMRAVAKKEQVDVETLRSRIAAGHVVIPANKNHTSISPEGIGEGMKTKINVNLGVSRDCCNIETELEKVKEAISLKAEAIMDLSSFGKTGEFRRRVIEISAASIGTVPVYDAVGFYDKDLADISADEFLRVFEQHAKDGVDFMTVHAGINRSTAATFARGNRKLNIVSRGGSLLYAWMKLKNAENPFFEHFDDLLDICKQYDVTLSLGDACRPGCIADSTDSSQIHELITLGELTKRAWEQHVQVMIEGPGHMRLNEVAANVALEKRLCHGAPFYVLGPLVTDIAPGYDHITSAIGGAVAGMSGADFLCYVTPAEHLRLPTLEDMREGIFATKIAAHAADLAKGTDDGKWDDAMADARHELDWEKMFTLAIDPEKARRYRKDSMPEDGKTCTMCGKMCSVRNMNNVMNGKDVNII